MTKMGCIEGCMAGGCKGMPGKIERMAPPVKVEFVPCRKCGTPEPKLEYRAPMHAIGKAFPDALQCTCTRCGFKWNVPCLDAMAEPLARGE